jgi:hypothetical protein
MKKHIKNAIEYSLVILFFLAFSSLKIYPSTLADAAVNSEEELLIYQPFDSESFYSDDDLPILRAWGDGDGDDLEQGGGNDGGGYNDAPVEDALWVIVVFTLVYGCARKRRIAKILQKRKRLIE